jgi:para-aminobenzoate synthetase component 2
MGTEILVIDNYDSFVFNLVQYLQQLGAECTVVRNDEVNESVASNYDGILISPGPGTPEDAGISMALIKRAAEIKKPILGVCLGHQVIATAYGATVDRAPELLHGRTSEISHDSSGIYQEIPNPFTATRYHSLAIREETLPRDLIITGRSESGVVMSIQHRELPIFGVQFHPESVLTEYGHLLLANWLVVCGMVDAVAKAKKLPPVLALIICVNRYSYRTSNDFGFPGCWSLSENDS